MALINPYPSTSFDNIKNFEISRIWKKKTWSEGKEKFYRKL